MFSGQHHLHKRSQNNFKDRENQMLNEGIKYSNITIEMKWNVAIQLN